MILQIAAVFSKRKYCLHLLFRMEKNLGMWTCLSSQTGPKTHRFRRHRTHSWILWKLWTLWTGNLKLSLPYWFTAGNIQERKCFCYFLSKKILKFQGKKKKKKWSTFPLLRQIKKYGITISNPNSVQPWTWNGFYGYDLISKLIFKLILMIRWPRQFWQYMRYLDISHWTIAL